MLPIIYWAIAIPITVYAVRFGEEPERFGAAFTFFASVLTTVVMTALPDEVRYAALERVVAAIDFILLIGWLYLALHFDRYWTLCAAGFQLVTVATHLVMIAVPGVVPYAYEMAQGFWAYPIWIAILIGTRQREKFRRQMVR